MAKKTSAVLVNAQEAQSVGDDPKALSPLDRKAVLDTIEAERHRIVRARAIAQIAAKLLHEFYLNERNEPDIGSVLGVVCDLLEVSIAGLDRMTLSL